jgi:hypothetical protein
MHADVLHFGPQRATEFRRTAEKKCKKEEINYALGGSPNLCGSPWASAKISVVHICNGTEIDYFAVNIQTRLYPASQSFA